jgi:uncharacterized BrkB/YihY/UPF0761 family membrane protein
MRRLTKGLAFVLCLVFILLIYISVFGYVIIALIIKKDSTLIQTVPVNPCLAAAVTVTTTFMGIQMANNGVKGHNWKQEMFDSENNTEGKNDGKK